MARLLTRKQMIAVTDVSSNVFDTMLNRRGMALTFGVERAPVRDRYIATDPVFARATIEFSRQFRIPQPVIAELIRQNNVVVLDGIVRAEHEGLTHATDPERSLGLAMIKGRGGDVQLACGTNAELRELLFGPPPANERMRPPQYIDQVTVINLTGLIVSIRKQAAKVGVDLGDPLFATPDDPVYLDIRKELIAIRDANAKVMRKATAYAALRERITTNVAIQ